MEATNKLEHFKWLLEQYAIRTVLHEQKRQTALAMMQTEGQNQPTANRAVLYALDDQRRAFDNLVEHYEREMIMDVTKTEAIQTMPDDTAKAEEKSIGPGALICMKTFAIDGPELLPRGGTWALKHACELADVIGDNSREIFMLTRRSFVRETEEVPFVVVVSQKASKEDALSAFKRAIAMIEASHQADHQPTKGLEFPSATHEWAEKMRAKELAGQVRSQTIQAIEFPGQTQEAAAKISAQQEPACGVVASEVGTIRADKPSTKALEKIIKRQEKRIEELARKNGNLECVVTSYEPFHERLLAATKSKGLSEAVAVAENAISEYAKSRIVPLAKQD